MGVTLARNVIGENWLVKAILTTGGKNIPSLPNKKQQQVGVSMTNPAGDNSSF